MVTSSAQIHQGVPEQGPFINIDAAALPAAGAFTVQAYTKLPAKARRLSVIVTYAKGSGAASGSATLRLQWQLSTAQGPTLDDVYETVIDASAFSAAAPFATMPEYALEILGPVTTTSISFRMISAEVPVDAVGARVLAAEITDTANPGTISVRFYTSDQV